MKKYNRILGIKCLFFSFPTKNDRRKETDSNYHTCGSRYLFYSLKKEKEKKFPKQEKKRRKVGESRVSSIASSRTLSLAQLLCLLQHKTMYYYT